MPQISLQILRFINPSQPGWVECALVDAFDRQWLLTDKVPIFTTAHLDTSSDYPRPGVVACEIVREWTDDVGRKRCLITTERPWGVAAQNGETEFEVFLDQLTADI